MRINDIRETAILVVSTHNTPCFAGSRPTRPLRVASLAGVVTFHRTVSLPHLFGTTSWRGTHPTGGSCKIQKCRLWFPVVAPLSRGA